MFSRSLSLAILCLSLVAKKCHVRAYLHTHVKRGVSSTAVVGVHSKDKSERKELTDHFRRLQVEASIVAPIEVTVVSIEDGFDKAGKGGCSDVGGKVGTGACLQGGKALTGGSGRGKTGVEKTTKAGKDEEGSIASKISSSTSKASKGKATKGAKGKKEKISRSSSILPSHTAAQNAPPSLAPNKSPTVGEDSSTNLLGAETSSSERVIAGSICVVGLLVGFIMA